MGEDSLFGAVTTVAEERHLSQNTLTAYRRTWLKLIVWAAAEGLALETLPSDRAGKCTRRRLGAGALPIITSRSKPLPPLDDVLDATDPFAECLTSKFSPEKTELRYHTASQLGRLLRELREEFARLKSLCTLSKSN